MKKSITLLMLLLLFLASCQKFDTVVDEKNNKDIQTNGNAISNISDLVISDDFDWSMIKTVDIQILLPEEANQKLTKILSLDRNIIYFNGYPEDNSNLLKTKVTFPTYVDNVLIEYGSGIIGKVVSIAGNTKTLSTSLISNLKATDWEPHITASQSIYATTPPTCGVNLTSNVAGTIEIEDDLVYCVPEGLTITIGDIKFKGDGGTLYVKGKLIVDQINIQGNSTGYVFVASTGEIEADNIFLNKMTEFINHGTVNNDGEPAVDADLLFENFGTLNCDGIVNNSEDFLNAGTMNVDGQFNNTGIGINEGTIVITGSNGHFNNTGNPSIEFYNYCKIYVEQNFNESSNFYHYGYLEVDKSTNITGSSDRIMLMGQYSLVVTKDLDIQGNVEGPSESGAKFKVSEVTKISAAADISGFIQICDSSVSQQDMINSNATLGSNVNFGCDLVIPENECIPGDGPIDPPKPETFDGTLAFEDLWPGKGDYDINDLVVEYNFEIDKDNNEKIRDITATFTIRAFGAQLHNGFGFSFPNVSPSDIISVTGFNIQSSSIFSMAANGVENGQSNATFIVFDDPFNIMAHPGSGIGVNTDHSAPYVDPVTITLYIDFVDNVISYSQLNIGQFNPFIIVNQVREMEVHLPDYPPTDLHNPSYFSTFSDDSNPSIGRYYKTPENLFWAINIPEKFDYPNEKQVIIGAYYKFAEWAQSNGVLFPNWYKDLPGYRNTSAIY